jgi:hypothetical protein
MFQNEKTSSVLICSTPVPTQHQPNWFSNFILSVVWLWGAIILQYIGATINVFSHTKLFFLMRAALPHVDLH